MLMSDWYQKDFHKVLDEFDSNAEQGLSAAEAVQRLEKYGPNELIETGRKSPWRILFEQFTDTMVIVLIIAALISFLLGEMTDAVAILVIVLLNGLLGFSQENKAEKAMQALKQMAVPTVTVRRDNRIIEIASKDLVPGDILILEAGNLVPADCRLVESVNLHTQEAALTGESQPVSKKAKFLPNLEEQEHKSIPLADRINMVYMGTMVTYGRGTALVTETGMETELGGIAELMQASGYDMTPLQRRLDQLGKGLALAAGVLVAIVFFLGILRGEELKLMFLTAISIAVAAIPEGLPAVVTIALALGARRMLNRQALIRKLPAVEALGSVTVICSDKTGTLTENRMTVTVLDVAENRIDLTENEIRLPIHGHNVLCWDDTPNEEQKAALKDNPALTLLLAGGALCNDAVLDCEPGQEDYHIVGDPTEGALLVSAQRMGLAKKALEEMFPRVSEVPFDSERKRMTTTHATPKDLQSLPAVYQEIWMWEGWTNADNLEYITFTKGAIDSLVDICDRVWVQDHIEEMSKHWEERIDEANKSLALNGMRVLGVACKAVDELPQTDADDSAADMDFYESNLIFVGMVGMIDPARPEVKEAVQTCRTAGIRPVMITGDHPLTAGYIARELGIISENARQIKHSASPESDQVLTGVEIDHLNQTQLNDVVEKVSVYARVSPEHKLRIVEALQTNGEIAAMTGDGVNDAPALKRADIGVAMGITGTDVSKEASDMVLLDDNFATIVSAVREGRVIYDNIRKFIQYTLTSNTGEIVTMLVAPFLGMPLPLLPIQILWINLVTDGLPGLALGVELGEKNTMQRPPYPPQENVFARGLARNIILLGFLMGLISLGVGFVYWMNGSEAWQTMVFTTLTLSEMTYVLSIRSNLQSTFKLKFFGNPALIGAVALTTFLQLAVIYVPFLQNVFNTVALSGRDLLISIVISTSLFWVVELRKYFLRRKDVTEQVSL
jgi:P-type Ca2+ transporter type 2C